MWAITNWTNHNFCIRFMFMSVCFVYFYFFFGGGGLVLLFWGCIFFNKWFSLFYLLKYNWLNGRSVITTLYFYWMSLLFMGFVFMISCLVILYSDDYMFGDLNIVRFIWLFLIFVVPIIFLIISPNVISIWLDWDGVGLVST